MTPIHQLNNKSATQLLNLAALQAACKPTAQSLNPDETGFLSKDEITTLNVTLASLNHHSTTLNHLISQAKARHQNAQAITFSLV